MILVTGATGMFGGVLVGRLSAKKKVCATSTTGGRGTEALDLTSLSAVETFFKNHSLEAVVHAAAFSDVDGCERDPGRAHAVNALGTKAVAEVCGRRGIPLIALSTDYVFDGRKRSPYRETDAAFPVNVYGITKLTGEYWVRQSKASWVILRTSWLFGGNNPKNFVNTIIERLQKESLVRVLDDQEDAPTSVHDLAQAVERVLETLSKDRLQDIFHVCNAGSATRYQMTAALKDLLGLRKVRVEKADPGQIQGRLAVRPRYAVMSPERFEKKWGMKMRPWQDALADFLAEKSLCVSS
ncbi:MAG: dTDP-4-dehydrorhamnose reductase [Candidatus Omnitrophica bacterium]|nr:dTDP-4-dehydrorhamnose reductase [Candidatus Omnitrophota bacterium]